MARISVREAGNRFIVDVQGALVAADLRRLERACGPAIERQRALELVFVDGGPMDPTACAYVDRLRSHGAAVTLKAPAQVLLAGTSRAS